MTARYTKLADEALHRAQDEAQALRAQAVEPEHLFLALNGMTQGIAAQVLHQDLHLEAEQVNRVVAQVSAKFTPVPAPSETVPANASALDEALFRASQEARDAHHHWVGTEHLLLGLTALDDRPMREIFSRLNLAPADIRAQVHARVPEIPLRGNRRAKLKDRLRTEFYHNFAFYVPKPIRALFGRFLDSSKMPPLG